MAFVPIQDSGLDFGFFGENGEEIVDSVVSTSANNLGGWQLFNIGAAVNFRITIQFYEALTGGDITNQATFQWGSTGTQVNQTVDGSGFTPSPVTGQITAQDIVDGEDQIRYVCSQGSEGNPEETYSFLIEVELAAPPVITPNYVYELEKGWSFDGNYIPHFAELNWYFGDNPVEYHGIQKIRIHGLSKGRTYLQVSTNGMETDYLPDYSEPQYIDLPYTPTFVSADFKPITNTTNTANRGLAIQMKFEGRNQDITLPEPSHVIQVLVIQSSPVGTGARAE